MAVSAGTTGCLGRVRPPGVAVVAPIGVASIGVASIGVALIGAVNVPTDSISILASAGNVRTGSLTCSGSSSSGGCGTS